MDVKWAHAPNPRSETNMDTKIADKSAGKCPFSQIAGVGRTNRDW